MEGARREAHLDRFEDACVRGQLDVVQELCGRHPDLVLLVFDFEHAEEWWYGGRGTGLHLAARNDHVSCCRALLDAGADVNAVGGNERTPLMYAEHFDVLTLLLRRGADVHARDIWEWTALHHCVFYFWDKRAVLALVSAGADIHALDSDSWSPLMEIALENELPNLRHRGRVGVALEMVEQRGAGDDANTTSERVGRDTETRGMRGSTADDVTLHSSTTQRQSDFTHRASSSTVLSSADSSSASSQPSHQSPTQTERSHNSLVRSLSDRLSHNPAQRQTSDHSHNRHVHTYEHRTNATASEGRDRYNTHAPLPSTPSTAVGRKSADGDSPDDADSIRSSSQLRGHLEQRAAQRGKPHRTVGKTVKDGSTMGPGSKMQKYEIESQVQSYHKHFVSFLCHGDLTHHILLNPFHVLLPNNHTIYTPGA